MSEADDHATDEMVKAGVVALLSCEIGAATDSEIVRKVYAAMRMAARGETIPELSDKPDET